MTLSVAAAGPGGAATLSVAPDDYCASPEQQTWLGSLVGYDAFTNGGSYVPRVECMQTADGSPDWFWIIALIVLTLGVIAWYARIFQFWRQCYFAEAPEDRNKKMMQLANIFLWCAVCGYAMSVVMFFWPAYRLLAIFLFILNIWSWRFVSTMGDFRISLSAKRLERELRESLESRAAELEVLVERRTAEAQAARAEAEAANRSKSMFLANMSHEIRTPMTAILGFTDLLDDPDASDTERGESLDTIKRNSTHLLQVINDILDLSKIESGEMSAEAIACDPRVVVEDTLRLYHERASTKGIVLSCDIDDDLPAQAVTDPTRLRQILFNLVSNAIKFTSAGSVVVHARCAGDDLEFCVTDTGLGMSDDQLRRIFEPFAQADESTTRRFGGTGLGLSIARALAQKLGGDIHATSTIGEGSAFTVRVKRSLQADDRTIVASGAAQRIESASPMLALRTRRNCLSGRALLVEDGPDNQKLISHVLRRAGLDVDVADNGRTGSDRAIEAVAGGRPYDVIIMDMQMPEMDGYEATRRLRDRGIEVPVVALTANAMSGDRDRCIEAGCTDYATKPLNVPILLDLLSRLLDQGEDRRDAA
jgi:signal transduction histidine kinase/ActR/RegA family two-component response regulator